MIFRRYFIYNYLLFFIIFFQTFSKIQSFSSSELRKKKYKKTCILKKIDYNN